MESGRRLRATSSASGRIRAKPDKWLLNRARGQNRYRHSIIAEEEGGDSLARRTLAGRMGSRAAREAGPKASGTGYVRSDPASSHLAGRNLHKGRLGSFNGWPRRLAGTA